MKRPVVAILSLLVLVVAAIVYVVTRPVLDRPSREASADRSGGESAKGRPAPRAPDPTRAGPERPRSPGEPRPGDGAARGTPPAGESEPARSRRGSISGRVADSWGRPIDGAIVYRIASDAALLNFVDDAFRVRTDAEGKWRLPVGTDVITDLGAAKLGYRPALMTDVSLVAGEVREGVDFVLGEGAQISGRVTEPGGKPIAGVRVSASRDAQVFGRAGNDIFLPGRSLIDRVDVDAETDDKGVYAIRGLAADVEFRVAPSSDSGQLLYEPESGDERRVRTPAEGVDFVLIRSVGVTVHVVDAASGSPIPSFQVTLARQSVQRPSSTSAGVNESLDGTLKIDRHLAPGPYLLTVSAVDYEPCVGQEADLSDPDAPHDVTVRLRQHDAPTTGILHVSVKDERGEPIPRAYVFALFQGEAATRGRFGSSDVVAGAAEIKSLEAGRYRVEARAAGTYFQPAQGEADVRAGEATLLELWMPTGGRIALDIKNTEGEYVSDVVTQITGEAGQPVSTTFEVRTAPGLGTIPAGGGAFPGHSITGPIPAGSYELKFVRDGYQPQTAAAVVRRGEDVFVNVVLYPER